MSRVDFEEPVFAGEEVASWPAGAMERLLGSGLLRETELAGSVECDACGEGHVEEVQYVIAPRGTAARPHIPCPDCGRVLVAAAENRSSL